MSYVPGNAQHIGRREEQQDSFAFSDLADQAFVEHGGVLAVVADGMGGMEGGSQTSDAAVRAFLDCYLGKLPKEPISRALTRSLEAANRAVCAVRDQHSEPAGTTLVAVVLHHGTLYWISVGDSRAYLRRSGQLARITVDHNYATELDLRVARGELDASEAANEPQREALTSHLGQSQLFAVDRNATPLPLEAGDLVLVASDGLYKALDEAEILRLASATTPQRVCEGLVEHVLTANLPEQDNVTVIALSWAPESGASP